MATQVRAPTTPTTPRKGQGRSAGPTAGGGLPRRRSGRHGHLFVWGGGGPAAATAHPPDGARPPPAGQVVSDYLTPYDGEKSYLEARNRPVAVYTYRMAFTRHSTCAGGSCAGIAAS